MKWIAALVFGLLATAAQAAEPYFPAEYARETPCASGWPASSAIVSAFRSDWYSTYLRVAGEPSLYAARNTVERGAQIVRFTWLRTFDAPVTVRIDLPASGDARLVARMLSGAGGYEPGVVARKVDRKLTAAQTDRVRELLADPALTPSPAPSCEFPGLDGAQWIVERAQAGHYRFRDQQSPETGPVRTFGLALLDLTGWNVGKIY